MARLTLDLAGLYPPIPTPFKANGEIDYPHLESNVRSSPCAAATLFVSTCDRERERESRACAALTLQALSSSFLLLLLIHCRSRSGAVTPLLVSLCKVPTARRC